MTINACHELGEMLGEVDKNRGEAGQFKPMGAAVTAAYSAAVGPLGAVTGTVGGATQPVSGATDTVGGVTDKLGGTTGNNLLGGGEKKS